MMMDWVGWWVGVECQDGGSSCHMDGHQWHAIISYDWCTGAYIPMHPDAHCIVWLCMTGTIAMHWLQVLALLLHFLHQAAQRCLTA